MTEIKPITVKVTTSGLLEKRRFEVKSGKDIIFVSDSYTYCSENYSFTTNKGSAETSWEVNPKKTKRQIIQQLSVFYKRLEKYDFEKLTDNEKELGITVIGEKEVSLPLYGSENGELNLEGRLSLLGLHLLSKNHGSLRINTPYADIIFGNNSVMSLPTENQRIEVLSHNDISEPLSYLISSTLGYSVDQNHLSSSLEYPITQHQIESNLKTVHRFNRTAPLYSQDKRKK